MDVTIDEDVREAEVVVSSLWWLVLLTGVGWFLVALVILRFDTSSVSTVGVLLGFVLVGAAAGELLEAVVVPTWRVVHGLLGALFLAGGIWAFASPDDAFWSLASILGLLLVLKGTMDVVVAAESRSVNPVWGLGLAAGIFELLLGFWASQQYYPARAALILLWVAFMALLRGGFDLALGLQLRHAHKRALTG